MNRRLFADDPAEELREAEQQLDYMARYVTELRQHLRPRQPRHTGYGRSAYCLGAAIGTAKPAAHLRCTGGYARGNHCGCECHTLPNRQERYGDLRRNGH